MQVSVVKCKQLNLNIQQKLELHANSNEDFVQKIEKRRFALTS